MGGLEGAKLRGLSKESIFERIVSEPSISILNMTCGKPSGGNSIQESAECTIGIRLTSGQKPEKIEKVIRNYLESQPVLYNLKFSLKNVGLTAKAWKADTDKPIIRKYLTSLESCYGKKAVMPSLEKLPGFSPELFVQEQLEGLS